ncbi:Uncharacterized protein Adt_21312 [Abeliophyllum distichum]|uniref:Integrase zinc-binding domain-containing protein n=1 Tax=Abeliophyllum distichum TaxID=126358 RepID=A0ABD1SZ83_9LAMI
MAMPMLFSKLVSRKDFDLMKAIPVEKLSRPFIDKAMPQIAMVINESPKWIKEIIDGILYKRGFSHPLLRCIAKDEANYVMKETHEGICGNHSGGMALVQKALKHGYYWPTMKKDSHAYAKRCDKCQRFSIVPKLLA